MKSANLEKWIFIGNAAFVHILAFYTIASSLASYHYPIFYLVLLIINLFFKVYKINLMLITNIFLSIIFIALSLNNICVNDFKLPFIYFIIMICFDSASVHKFYNVSMHIKRKYIFLNILYWFMVIFFLSSIIEYRISDFKFVSIVLLLLILLDGGRLLQFKRFYPEIFVKYMIVVLSFIFLTYPYTILCSTAISYFDYIYFLKGTKIFK